MKPRGVVTEVRRIRRILSLVTPPRRAASPSREARWASRRHRVDDEGNGQTVCG